MSERILFLGNGINRVVEKNQKHSWDAALLHLEKLYLKTAHQSSDTIEGGNIYLTGVNRVIPEPTTATLSLLALAGLSMRRRRGK